MVFFLTAALFFIGCKSPADKITPGLQPSTKSASTSATDLPGGRAYYVVSLMGGDKDFETWSRIGQYEFKTNGTITGRTQDWNQNDPRLHDYWKVSSTYNTGGSSCGDYTCTVATPKGFEPNTDRPWATTPGTYTLDVPNSRVTITWSTNSTETWTINNPSGENVRGDAKAYTKLVYYSSNYYIRHGYGCGSNSDFTKFANLSTMRGTASPAPNLEDVDVWGNMYEPISKDYNQCRSGCPGGSTYFSWDNRVEVCNSDVYRYKQPVGVKLCTQCGAQPGAGGILKNYVASSSTGMQGRQTYWQYQNGWVACGESCANTCITPGGGHTVALLQVIDDNGKFQGFIGAEASIGYKALYGRYVAAMHFLYK